MPGAATASFKRQIWYLTPELVVLALFGDGTSEWEKEQIVRRLLQFQRPNQFNAGKVGQPNFQPQAAHIGPDRPALSVFVTARSWLLFHLFGVEERDLA